jgi:hypothetical protein
VSPTCGNKYYTSSEDFAINAFFVNVLFLSKEVSWKDQFEPSSLVDITTNRGIWG